MIDWRCSKADDFAAAISASEKALAFQMLLEVMLMAEDSERLLGLINQLREGV